MLFIISPAKKMVDASDSFAWHDLPRFLSQACELLEAMHGKSYDELKSLWACSDALASLNYDRVQRMDPCDDRLLTPAAFSYEGIQYQNMAPHVMTAEQLEYLQNHLRILSGFYGVLRPFDGVTPYRLEMQAKLAMPSGANGAPARNLYEFWGSRLYDALCEDIAASGQESDCAIVNLASVEYAKAVEPYAKATLAAHPASGSIEKAPLATGTPLSVGAAGGEVLKPEAGRGSAAMAAAPRYVTCLFGSMKSGKFTQRSTEAKAARGTFVRWCAENNVRHVSDFQHFDIGGYQYNEALSSEDTFVFTH